MRAVLQQKVTSFLRIYLVYSINAFTIEKFNGSFKKVPWRDVALKNTVVKKQSEGYFQVVEANIHSFQSIADA